MAAGELLRDLGYVDDDYIPAMIRRNEEDIKFLEEYTSVSYTHLDVYKRQQYDNDQQRIYSHQDKRKRVRRWKIFR